MTVEVEKVLSDIIRIQSVNPPGGETAVAVYLKNLFDEHKIPSEIIEPLPGRGSFVATFGSCGKSMLFLSHADVVPVGNGWNFDSFSGEIRDGFVHGRGAIDCKGLVAAEACAFISLVESGKLKGKLIFAAMADEEAGGVNGAGYITEKYPEKVKADFAINEGAEPITINGKEYQNLSIGEKAPSWLKIRTRGIAGHGSRPVLESNAIVKMARVISALANYKPAVILTPETKRLIQTVAEIYGTNIGLDAKKLDSNLKQLPDTSLVVYLMAITRMTVSPNIIKGGIKTNIVPDLCEAEVDIRVLPGQDWSYVLKEIRPLVGDAEIEPLQVDTASFSEVDNKYYELIESTLKELTGNNLILPSVTTGSTDSKYMRKLGIPSYGTGVITLNPDQAMKNSVHGVNEKIDVASLQLKTKFLQRVAEKYLCG
ncbi:MAG: putative metallohydrolase [Dehalococcoidales bacterium]|nr:putative metallohydrolase [Dehalococcoidales bacterium]